MTAPLDQLVKFHHEDSGRHEARVQSLLTSLLEGMPSGVATLGPTGAVAPPSASVAPLSII